MNHVFANHQEHPYLLFLGAYRHNEVDQSHPLWELIEKAKEENKPLVEIRLKPLEPRHSHEMVSYILDSPLPETKALADFINSFSEGNPLFMLFMGEDRQLCWDIEKIRRSSMPTTIAALFSSKIQKLPRELIENLEYCACMGNSFSPAELSAIGETTLAKTFDILKPALSQGLLVEHKGQLQFIHDKVQEAVLAYIPEDRRRKIHWQLGNFLLETARGALSEPEKLDNLFTIVSHFNLGKEEDLDRDTAYVLSDLNYHAGNKALNSLATEAANECFSNSRKLLPADRWEEKHYRSTFRIFQKAAKTKLMCGNYSESKKLLNTLLQNARTDLDKAECLAEQTTSLSSIGNFIKAIETANKGLAYLGKSIPEDPEEANQRCRELMADIAARDIDIFEPASLLKTRYKRCS